jgi:hypothetical protein
MSTAFTPTGSRGRWIVALLVLVGPGSTPLSLQTDPSADGRRVYEQIRAFALEGGSATVTTLVLERDRARLTFTGTFYFAAPVGDRTVGAVFIGEGTVRAEVPPSEFERDNVRRLIDADVVESDFKTAVLRWTDDTFERIGASRQPGEAPPEAQRLAERFEARFTTETGANLPARLASSLLNGEAPGVFVAQFDGGRRGRFTYREVPVPGLRRRLPSLPVRPGLPLPADDLRHRQSGEAHLRVHRPRDRH